MSTHPLTSAKPRGLIFCGVFGLFAAGFWCLAGCVVFMLSFLDVHAWVTLVPMILLAAAGLLGFSALLLLQATGTIPPFWRVRGQASRPALPSQAPADGRPPMISLLGHALAVVGALSYWLLLYEHFTNPWSLDPGSVLLHHFPGAIALLVLLELAYLCWLRSLPGN